METNPDKTAREILDALMPQLRTMLPGVDWNAEPRKEPLPIHPKLPQKWTDLPGVSHFGAVAVDPGDYLGAPMTLESEEGKVTWLWWQWQDKGASPVELALMLAHSLGFAHALRTVSSDTPHACNPFCDLTREQRRQVRAGLDLADFLAEEEKGEKQAKPGEEAWLKAWAKEITEDADLPDGCLPV